MVSLGMMAFLFSLVSGDRRTFPAFSTCIPPKQQTIHYFSFYSFLPKYLMRWKQVDRTLTFLEVAWTAPCFIILL